VLVSPVCLQAYLRFHCGSGILAGFMRVLCDAFGGYAEPLVVRVVENEGRALGAEVGELKNFKE